MQKRKRGFTLVELSIVLVIIGLLIGGILVAQSMIETSKIVATVKQIQQFDAGVEAFKTKYNALPGDSTLFGGNGDGYVDLGATNADACFAQEDANFWNEWNPAQFAAYAALWPGTKVISSGPNANVPASKVGKPGAFFWAGALGLSSGSYALDTTHGNYYIILDGTTQMQVNDGYCVGTIGGDNGLDEALTPPELLALDTKMDDGVANTGSVLSGALGGANHYPTYISTGSTYCSNGTSYLLTGSHAKSYECTPLIQIGAQAGDPQ